MSKQELSYPPGFRFHPTDEELILHYLRNRVTSLPIPVSIIAEVDIYKFNPWELPAKTTFGDREWYFFTPRERKYPNGIRPNRAAASGYWKATGTDKPIVSGSGGVNIGVKKALVFYKGKPPKGHKTNWIMHEFRLAESPNCANNNFLMRAMKPRDASMRLDDWVLCRIYQKTNNQTKSTQPTIESQEVEQSANLMDETYLSVTSNLSHHNNSGRLPKSSTLSEMFPDGELSTLSHFLYDNPTEISNTMGYQNFNQSYYLNNHNNGINIIPRLSEASPLATTNNLRQKRAMEEDSSALLHQSKKFNTSNNDTQCNTVNQAYLNPNLMWNSHMGLH